MEAGWPAQNLAPATPDAVAGNLANLYVNYEAGPSTPSYKNGPETSGWVGPNMSPGRPRQHHRPMQDGPGPQNQVGWGGQAIPEGQGFRVPWFGRSRGKGPGQNFGGRGRGRDRGGYLGGRRGGRRHYGAGGHSEHESGEEGLSVEEIVGLLQNLPKAQPLPEQVFQALFHFDSRSTALLFKDLSKAGVGQRAVELFDWLRKLEDGHPLHSLCDVYTYTAMIAQCIYQQVHSLELKRLACHPFLHECRQAKSDITGRTCVVSSCHAAVKVCKDLSCLPLSRGACLMAQLRDFCAQLLLIPCGVRTWIAL